MQRWLEAERWRSLARPFGRLRRTASGPKAQAVPAAPKLYVVLGVAASAEDWEIDVAYRRRAAQISSSQFAKPRQLKELNAAYEVLGNPARRAEYDRQVAEGTEDRGYATTMAPELDPPRGAAQYPRFHHPQRARPSGRGYSELLGLIVVVAVAILAGRYLLERVEVDLSGITAITGGLGIGSVPFRAEPSPSPSPSPTVAATGQAPATGATPAPAAGAPAAKPTASPTAGPPPLREQLEGSTVTVSNPQPRPNTAVSLVVRLVRNGQPAANVETWTTVRFRTVEERWPPQGTVRTDANGTAVFTNNIGAATVGHEVPVTAHARVEDQELTFTASFTPQ